MIRVERLFYSRLITILALCILLHSCIISSECEGYVGEANIHLRLEHGGGRGYTGHRIYISKTDSFGADYIQFNSTEVNAPRIYYEEPDMLYVRDRDSFCVTDIKTRQFKIKYINHIFPADLKFGDDSATYNAYMRTIKNIERIDSCISSKADYEIDFYNDATSFSVFDAKGKHLLNCTTIHWLF